MKSYKKVMIHQAFMRTRNLTHTNAPVSSVEPFTYVFAGLEPREQMPFSLFQHMREYACPLCIKCIILYFAKENIISYNSEGLVHSAGCSNTRLPSFKPK